METDTQRYEIAEPLPGGEWCEFCENKLAVMWTADDPPVAACATCAAEAVAALQSYEDDEFELKDYLSGFIAGPFWDSRAHRRARGVMPLNRHRPRHMAVPRSRNAA